MSNTQTDPATDVINQQHEFKSTGRTPADVAGRAVSIGKTGFGVMANPKIRAVIAAICLQHPEIDPLMGDLEVLGSNIYISASCWMKLLHSRVPIACRRWQKRIATTAEYDTLGFEKWQREETYQGGYMGRGSRLWWMELQMRPFTDLKTIQTTGGVFVVAKPDGDWFTIAGEFGEANEQNVTLQNSSKLKGDPRVLDRMAIKRGHHACLQETVSFQLEHTKDLDQVSLLAEGVRLIPEDSVHEGQLLEVGERRAEMAPAPMAVPAAVGDQAELDSLRESALRKGVPPRLIERVVAQAVRSDDPQASVAIQSMEIHKQMNPTLDTVPTKPKSDRDPPVADAGDLMEIMLKRANRIGIDPSTADVTTAASMAVTMDDPLGWFERWLQKHPMVVKRREAEDKEPEAVDIETPVEPAGTPAEARPSKPAKPPKPKGKKAMASAEKAESDKPETKSGETGEMF